MKKSSAKPRPNKSPSRARGKSAGPSFTPTRKHDLLMREEAGGTVYVMSPTEHKKFYFVIDGLAADLWRAIDGKTTVEEHVTKLSRSFRDVAPAKVRRDVTKFIADLKKLGLVD